MKVTLKILAISMLLLPISGCMPVIFGGATGSALEFAKDRSAGETLTDISIATQLKGKLAHKSFRNLYNKVKVDVIKCRVLLTGVVGSQKEVITSIQLAWENPKVTEVINEIEVSPNSNKFDIVQYTRDTLITSQIKSKSFIGKDIKFVNYSVITNNDVVYLFGIARSEPELEKVSSIAANIHGVKKVISHVRIDPWLKRTRASGAQSDDEDNNYADDTIIDELDQLISQDLSHEA